MFDKLFKRKEKEPLPDVTDVHVTLKPILGIRPGVYLIALYSVIALAVIFVLFFLSGLVDAGSYLNFGSQPLPAGVWIDGKKAGVTPCEILVKEGRHEISIGRPGYETITEKRDVTRFVFALPFLPKKEYIDVSLKVADIHTLARDAFRDFSEWALVEAFSTDYPYPPVLTDAAKSIFASPDDETYNTLSALLERALPSVHLPELAADWLEAYVIVQSRGQGPSSRMVSAIFADLRRSIDDRDNLAFFLYNVLPKNLAKTESAANNAITTKDDLEKTEWFRSKTDAYRAYLARFSAASGARPGAGLALGGVSFLPVPDGTYLMGRYEKEGSLLGPDFIGLFPHPVKVKGFYMAQTEVTNRQFRLFVQENPEWRADNRARLMAKNQVDEFYLKDWQANEPPAGRDSYPAVYVSAYAAEAYCAWLSGKLQAILPGWSVRLPYEAEWEWAAAGGNPARFKTSGSRLYSEFSAGLQAAGASAPNLFGLSDMAGNAFEWCRDWFAPAAPLLSSSRPEKNVYDRYGIFTTGGAKSVRGGSWATNPAEIEAYTRAGQPPEWSTPFLGFRPVIAVATDQN
jgi:iron(II)-dependent oxidoreductase